MSGPADFNYDDIATFNLADDTLDKEVVKVCELEHLTLGVLVCVIFRDCRIQIYDRKTQQCIQVVD